MSGIGRRISAMTPAGNLDGTEMIPCVQNGLSRRTTVGELATGSGLITSAAGVECGWRFQTNHIDRLRWMKTSDAEGIGRVGSNGALVVLDNAGTAPITAFTVSRADGMVTYLVNPFVGANRMLHLGDFATVADIRADVALKIVTQDVMTAARAAVALTAGTPVSVNGHTGINFTLTAAQNFTLANMSNKVLNRPGRIEITQDGTGSRIITWGSDYEFAGGSPTLSTAAAARDILYYEAKSSTVVNCRLEKAFA